MLVATIAGLCGLGVMLMCSGLYRLHRQALTSRRVAALLTEQQMPGRDPLSMLRASDRWRLELRQALAQLEARDSILRGPAFVVTGMLVVVGLASASPGWLALATLVGLAAYLLGARERRRRRIESQALDAMGLLASGLRAGYSVPQAIALVAKHSPEPTATEFSRAAQEISVGVQLSDAIGRLARRTANVDYELVAIIIRVQQELGGNLAQILDSVGNTLRERLELRRQVEALTAQQRLSSIVLTVLPFALLTFLFLMDRSFVDPLFSNPTGRVLLAVSALMVLLGWTIMRSMGRVEV